MAIGQPPATTEQTTPHRQTTAPAYKPSIEEYASVHNFEGGNPPLDTVPPWLLKDIEKYYTGSFEGNNPPTLYIEKSDSSVYLIMDDDHKIELPRNSKFFNVNLDLLNSMFYPKPTSYGPDHSEYNERGGTVIDIGPSLSAIFDIDPELAQAIEKYREMRKGRSQLIDEIENELRDELKKKNKQNEDIEYIIDNTNLFEIADKKIDKRAKKELGIKTLAQVKKHVRSLRVAIKIPKETAEKIKEIHTRENPNGIRDAYTIIMDYLLKN